MAGIFSKSATVPLHTWLPDAGVAPSTITSLLHAAILVKIGLYGFARMFCNGMVIPDGYWVWILGFAMASAFISACAALKETNIKRLLAYSTVSQIGYTFLGLRRSPPAATSAPCSTSWPTASPRAACSCAPASSSTAPTPRT